MSLREKLAALEHEQWSHWFQIQDKTENDYYGGLHDGLPMQAKKSGEIITKWSELSNTPYKDLSEKEKESDREWADKVIQLLVDLNIIEG